MFTDCRGQGKGLFRGRFLLVTRYTHAFTAEVHDARPFRVAYCWVNSPFHDRPVRQLSLLLAGPGHTSFLLLDFLFQIWESSSQIMGRRHQHRGKLPDHLYLAPRPRPPDPNILTSSLLSFRSVVYSTYTAVLFHETVTSAHAVSNKIPGLKTFQCEHAGPLSQPLQKINSHLFSSVHKNPISKSQHRGRLCSLFGNYHARLPPSYQGGLYN